jgi:hypothetical protein
MSKKKKEVLPQCQATLPDIYGGPEHVCELQQHSKYVKHRVGAVSWTNGGAERLRAEMAAKRAIKV